MHYARQQWVEPTDIDTAIQRLGSELNALSFDRLHATNYDLDYCYDEEKVRWLEEQAEMYNNGWELCVNYTEGLLNLDQFCGKMIEIGLGGYVRGHLFEYLPDAISQKYQLSKQSITDSEDDQDNDDEETFTQTS